MKQWKWTPKFSQVTLSCQSVHIHDMGSKYEEQCFPLNGFDMFVVLEGLHLNISEINIWLFTNLFISPLLILQIKAASGCGLYRSLHNSLTDFEIVDKETYYHFETLQISWSIHTLFLSDVNINVYFDFGVAVLVVVKLQGRSKPFAALRTCLSFSTFETHLTSTALTHTEHKQNKIHYWQEFINRQKEIKGHGSRPVWKWPILKKALQNMKQVQIVTLSFIMTVESRVETFPWTKSKKQLLLERVEVKHNLKFKLICEFKMLYTVLRIWIH